jgi:3-hydroxy-9,10-secoandrosta-1,3,5(10)-triene-9,17-dione monooxygenase reductase component
MAVSDDAALMPAHDLRRVAGTFPTGVTILTAASAGGPVGMAANSFTSLSLDPPLVLVCVGHSSSTWPLIEQTGEFCVNILAAGQEHLARRFALKGADRFVDVGFGDSPNGSPLLDGALGFIDCSIERMVEGGDHLVVIGAVTDLGVLRDGPPLVFHRSGFGLPPALELT